jgi:hypothetical protein
MASTNSAAMMLILTILTEGSQNYSLWNPNPWPRPTASLTFHLPFPPLSLKATCLSRLQQCSYPHLAQTFLLVRDSQMMKASLWRVTLLGLLSAMAGSPPFALLHLPLAVQLPSKLSVAPAVIESDWNMKLKSGLPYITNISSLYSPRNTPLTPTTSLPNTVLLDRFLIFSKGTVVLLCHRMMWVPCSDK